MKGDWEAAVAEFLLEKRRGRRSPRTLALYRHVLAGPHTAAWRQEHGVGLPVDVDAAALRRLELALADAGNSASTCHIYHRTMKTFLRWCQDEGWAINERALALPAPKLPEREPTTYRRPQVATIREASHSPRNAFLVAFLLHTGLRLSEVCAVTLDDLMEGPEGSWLRVRQGKGAKDRVVPLVQLNGDLRRYLRHTRGRSDDPHLFLSSRGGPLSPNAVRLALTRIGKRTGLHVHAHAFRHTWTTEALRAGIDMEAIRRAGGWTTYRMVQRYSHYSTEDLIDAWSRRRD